MSIYLSNTITCLSFSLPIVRSFSAKPSVVTDVPGLNPKPKSPINFSSPILLAITSKVSLLIFSLAAICSANIPTLFDTFKNAQVSLGKQVPP